MQKQLTFDIINILGGDSIFALQSKRTGVCYGYMVQKVKIEKSTRPASMYVNTYNVKISVDGQRYYYAGCIRHETCINTFKFVTNRDSYYGENSKCVKALMWALNNVGNESIIFYNYGKCSVCHSLLDNQVDRHKGYHNDCYIRGEAITKGINNVAERINKR